MELGDSDESKRFVDVDLSIECWGEVHKYWALRITIPSLIFWGFVVPFFALFLLIKNKNTLFTYRVKSRYGWLYEGFNKANFYWEFVITYRKILLIVLSVFLVELGKDIAVLFFCLINIKHSLSLL